MTHLSVALPPTDVLEGGAENLLLNISRDGRTVVYGARREGVQRLYVRRMGDGEPTALAGTEGGHSPFFSPDGQWIAFVANTKLRKVSVNGGPVFDICDDCPSADRAGVWLDDGSIVVVTNAMQPLCEYRRRAECRTRLRRSIQREVSAPTAGRMRYRAGTG